MYCIRFGPLVWHWTMRYEAKHSYFKCLENTLGNFINLPYFLAVRHQHHQCYIQSIRIYLHRVLKLLLDQG